MTQIDEVEEPMAERSTGSVIEGTVFSGLGTGGRFLRIPWVQRAMREQLGFDLFPGTLNLRLSNPESIARWNEIRERGGAPLSGERGGELSCGATLFSVIIEGNIEGAVVLPDVTQHDQSVLELVAPISLRERLSLNDGDTVRLQFTRAVSDQPSAVSPDHDNGDTDGTSSDKRADPRIDRGFA